MKIVNTAYQKELEFLSVIAPCPFLPILISLLSVVCGRKTTAYWSRKETSSRKMSGFTWKKRSGQCLSGKPRLAAFSASDDEASGSDSESGVATMAPSTDAPSDTPMQQPAAACSRPAAHPALSEAEQCAALREQGTALAELGRFWEALTFWDQAVALRPNDAELHEMRAQALLQLHELHPAAEAAARAAALRPRWSAAQQTLGRTLLGLGELSLARRAFSLAVHLQPDDAELRTDDLLWTSCLLERARRRGCLGATGGVVSDEQTDTLLNLLRWPASATAGAARCHVDWQPLAEDWLAEEREKERAEELREEEQAEERARRDAEEEERQRRAAARRARNGPCGDMNVDPE
ncbi:tetratricopeptide repeat protein 33-like isoform X1 [Amphibalanus amphitrite]|uniref:tetratricopeptide repeat protein 33-like isoform X1 n=2 Tax=Amphibalanus amphitrite TaxID=1232801 RepID=UPI001C924395|nr:tetratricopeptide repeat protein 33-like isoform X1 [Amphibalanus amphitrite]